MDFNTQYAYATKWVEGQLSHLTDDGVLNLWGIVEGGVLVTYWYDDGSKIGTVILDIDEMYEYLRNIVPFQAGTEVKIGNHAKGNDIPPVGSVGLVQRVSTCTNGQAMYYYVGFAEYGIVEVPAGLVEKA